VITVSILSFPIAKACEARRTLLGKKSSSISVSSKSSENQPNVDNDRKRRAHKAAERKAKVMAQMSQMQIKFMKGHTKELASMDTSELKDDILNNEVTEAQLKPKAVGVTKTASVYGNLFFFFFFNFNLKKKILFMLVFYYIILVIIFD
jgi:transcriptional regulator NrdR family protein